MFSGNLCTFSVHSITVTHNVLLSEHTVTDRHNTICYVRSASNWSCVIESLENGCLHGINWNILSGDVCSMTLINVSVPTTGGQILPELFLPTCSSVDKSVVHSVKPWWIPQAKISWMFEADPRVQMSLKRNLPRTGLWQPKNMLRVMRSLK